MSGMEKEKDSGPKRKQGRLEDLRKRLVVRAKFLLTDPSFHEQIADERAWWNGYLQGGFPDLIIVPADDPYDELPPVFVQFFEREWPEGPPVLTPLAMMDAATGMIRVFGKMVSRLVATAFPVENFGIPTMYRDGYRSPVHAFVSRCVYLTPEGMAALANDTERLIAMLPAPTIGLIPVPVGDDEQPVWMVPIYPGMLREEWVRAWDCIEAEMLDKMKSRLVDARIMDLHRADESIDDIATAMGLSSRYVRDRLTEHGEVEKGPRSPRTY